MFHRQNLRGTRGRVLEQNEGQLLFLVMKRGMDFFSFLKWRGMCLKRRWWDKTYPEILLLFLKLYSRFNDFFCSPGCTAR